MNSSPPRTMDNDSLSPKQCICKRIDRLGNDFTRKVDHNWYHSRQ